jgi:hypothetical protein
VRWPFDHWDPAPFPHPALDRFRGAVARAFDDGGDFVGWFSTRIRIWWDDETRFPWRRLMVDPFESAEWLLAFDPGWADRPGGFLAGSVSRESMTEETTAWAQGRLPFSGSELSLIRMRGDDARAAYAEWGFGGSTPGSAS